MKNNFVLFLVSFIFTASAINIEHENDAQKTFDAIADSKIHLARVPRDDEEKFDTIKKCGFVFECPAYKRSIELLKGVQGYQGVPGAKGVQCATKACNISSIGRISPPRNRCAESCREMVFKYGLLKGEKGARFPRNKEEARYLVKEAMKYIDLDGLFDDDDNSRRAPLKKRGLEETRAFSRNNFNTMKKSENPRQTAIIVDDIHSLHRVGKEMPVGTIVVSYLQNDVSTQIGKQSDMGMFIKTNSDENLWSRIPVELTNETDYEIPLKFRNSGFSHQSQRIRPAATSKFRLILSMLPVPLNGGALGSLQHAHHLCHKSAYDRLGIPGFRALMPDSFTSLEQIIPWHLNSIPVVNLAGQTLFRTWKDFLFGVPSTLSEPIYDLDGIPQNALIERWKFWLGGDNHYSCNWWKSTDPYHWGLVWTADPIRQVTKMTYSSCNTLNYVPCYKLNPGP